RDAAAALPPGNTVAQWNKIAGDTAVGSGAFQAEGFIYMAYASTAVYNSVVAIEGGQEPLLGSTITAPGRNNSRLRSRGGCLPHAALLLLVVPGSRGEPRRRLRRAALARGPCRAPFTATCPASLRHTAWPSFTDSACGWRGRTQIEFSPHPRMCQKSPILALHWY